MNEPLFVMFSKYMNKAEESFVKGDHQSMLVNLLIAATAAAAAGTEDSLKSSATIVHHIIPAYTEKYSVDMTGVEMPEGWRDELKLAMVEQQEYVALRSSTVSKLTQAAVEAKEQLKALVQKHSSTIH